MKTEDVARICHEANRAFCISHGDLSQPHWECAPDWQKESAVAGVKFLMEDASRGPAASHESWMKHKLDDGWVYGEKKDPEAKTHPCLVPYSQLPESQRIKDDLFLAIVNTFRSQVA